MLGRQRRVLILAAAAAVGGWCAGRSSASDKFWNNPLGGSFHDSANWNDTTPGTLDNAVFDLGSLLPYVVSLSSDVSNNQLRVGNDQVQLTFAPAVIYSLTSASPLVPAIVVGDLPGDVGDLNLVNATITTPGQIVVGAEGNGTLSIPAVSTVTAGNVSVGFVGNGHLFVQAGGTFNSGSASLGTNTDAQGDVVVSDPGSTWTNTGNLYVGDSAGGGLRVANGALVHSGGIFSAFAGSGSIEVDGGATLKSDSFIRVGETISASGTFLITNGGSADSVSGVLGANGGSGEMIIDGINSRWTLIGTLDVGLSGDGQLDIQQQGRLLAGAMTIGTQAGALGKVNVSDANSALTVGGLLTVGKEGRGTLLVGLGATVTSIGGVIGASSSDPNVFGLDGTGSSWNMGTNLLVVGDDGTGTLEISNGASVNNGPAVIGRGSAGEGSVVLDGSGATWTSSGLVNVGLNGNGLLQVTGGAVVNGAGAVIGGDAASGAAGSGSVALSGNNSRWNLSGALTIGGADLGSVALTSGAKLTDSSAIVGDGAGSNGIVDINGVGSSWTTTGLVRIANNGNADVTIDAGASASSGALDVGVNNAGNLTVTDANSSWTANGTMRVGVGHFGTLIVDAGAAVVSPSSTVGAGIGGIGQVIVRNGSAWNNPGVLNVGRGNADGFISIESGGQLSSGPANLGGDGSALGGNGAVIVKGFNSHWQAGAIVLGLGGSGDVESLSGGVIDAASLVISNGPAGSLGSVKVDAATLNVAGGIEVARDVTGTLNVLNGGSITSGGSIMGTLPSATATATIDGINSQWNIGGNLDVAVNGAGILNVGNGARVSAANAFVGRGPSGTGSVTISGAGILDLNDSLYIGGDSTSQQGNGTVSFVSGSSLSVANQIKIWATGTLNFEGLISAPLIDLQGGLLNGNGGVGSVVSSTNGRISTTSTLMLSGPLSIVTGTNLIKQGPGTLTINGTQNHGAGATLNVAGGAVVMNTDAGAPASAASAASAPLTVRVSGSSVTLGVNQDLAGLNVDFANPGTQSFNLASPTGAGAFRAVRIYAADLAGAKTSIYAAMKNANVSGAPDPADGIFDSGLASHANAKLGIAQLTDLHGDPYVLIRPTRIGDLNLDGTVTISDFIDLASNFNGVNKTWQEGDLNYDGAVTISDFIDLASNFNGAYSGSVQSESNEVLANFAASIGVDPSIIGSAVPEPSSLFALLGTALLATRRRRG